MHAALTLQGQECFRSGMALLCFAVAEALAAALPVHAALGLYPCMLCTDGALRPNVFHANAKLAEGCCTMGEALGRQRNCASRGQCRSGQYYTNTYGTILYR